MKKLIENFDDMIWKGIQKISEEELLGLEKKLGIKFPKNDRKYLKNFSGATGINVVLKIYEKIFPVEILSLKYYFFENVKYLYEGKREYFNERKVIPIIEKYEYLDEIGE